MGVEAKAELDALNANAKAKGVNLSRKATVVLQEAKFSCAVRLVLQVISGG